MIKNVFLAGFIILFTGCASYTYSIKPEYDEKSKILTIDTLKFENASLKSNFNPLVENHPLSFKRKIQTYGLGNSDCDSIHYNALQAGDRAYIFGDFDDLVRKRYSNSSENCFITEIKDLKFYSCSKLYQKDYIINLSIKNMSGHTSVESLFLQNLSCYNKFLDHFKEMANKNKIEVKEYYLNK